MPHQCTDCGRAFADGSKEMLSGCPDCGGTTFQFHPTERNVPEDSQGDPPERPASQGSVARTVGSAATTVRDLVGSSDGAAPAGDAPAVDEDAAQASARSDLVSPDELAVSANPDHADRPTPVIDDRTDSTDDSENRPDLSALRAELNDQFESIKVVEPGQYELNLMSLYDREEYIIALQEDGKYSIQVPERWSDED